MILSLEYLKEVSGGDSDLLKSLVDVMIDELEFVWDEFAGFRKDGDYEGMHRVVHTLKSKLDMLELTEESKYIREMENKLGNKILENQDEAYLEKLLVDLNTQIKKIKVS